MEIQIISLTIALLAVVISPIVTYKLAKKNFEIQFRLSVPIRWVDKLEESAHSFLLSTLEWIEKYQGIKDGSSQLQYPEKEIDRMFDTINSSIIKLELLLDTKKPLQQDILSNVIKAKSLINNRLFDDQTINELRVSHEQIVTKVKIVLQEERNKITKLFK